MNLNPFIDLISSLIELTKLSLWIYIISHWLVAFNILNPYQPFVSRLMAFLSRLLEPMLSVIRKYIPPIAGVDISPIILILLFGFTKSVLYTYLYRY